MEIGISFIAATVSLTLIFIFGWYSYKAEPVIQIPDISKFPFNQSTGKERSFVNKTGDSSMWIESTRRSAIAKAYRPDWCCGSKPIKETQHTTGSTSGVVEAYFLSAFGRICADPCTDEIVYDGGGDHCVLDGSGSVILDGNE